MAAVIGLDVEILQEVCRMQQCTIGAIFQRLAFWQWVSVANFAPDKLSSLASKEH
jgi:hypothetical protein